MTVGQLIEGLKHYDSELDVTIFDNNNDEQYDVSFIIEDEEKNLQVMIVFEGKQKFVFNRRRKNEIFKNCKKRVPNVR